MKRRKYRLKSKLRFTVSLIVMAVMAVCAFNGITGLNISSALEKPQYIQVEICHGDTLWAIADTYKSEDTDIRRAVYEICSLNSIDADDLVPGMVISFLKGCSDTR